MASPVFAQVGDIDAVEVKPDVVKYQLDTVKFLVITQTCVVTYRKVDAVGDPVGDEIQVIFQNVLDNPETPETIKIKINKKTVKFAYILGYFSQNVFFVLFISTYYNNKNKNNKKIPNHFK